MAAARGTLPVRVGLIGCGTIAYWAHLRTLQQLRGVTLAAAADPDPVARARAASMVRGTVHDQLSDLLLHDVDAVVISAPNRFHAELTVAAARAGKHVYVEKPLAITASEARTVVDVVSQSNVIATVGFNYRHHPAHQRARTLLKSGRIGAVRAVQSTFCEPTLPETMPEWKRRRGSGGGALLDLASHHVDLLRWLLDDEVATVDARITSTRTEDDGAMLALSMREGARAQMYVSFCAGPADFLEFIGEKGTLRVDRHRVLPQLRLARFPRYGVRSTRPFPTVGESIVWARRLVQPSYQPSFRRALHAFVRRIGGQAVHTATVEDGERSLAVVLAAEESARRNMPVAVP
jgi:myo-inositol 2-dehydrogenase / D-chiro-inositol 1-dehydrogenase